MSLWGEKQKPNKEEAEKAGIAEFSSIRNALNRKLWTLSGEADVSVSNSYGSLTTDSKYSMCGYDLDPDGSRHFECKIKLCGENETIKFLSLETRSRQFGRNDFLEVLSTIENIQVLEAISELLDLALWEIRGENLQ